MTGIKTPNGCPTLSESIARLLIIDD